MCMDANVHFYLPKGEILSQKQASSAGKPLSKAKNSKKHLTTRGLRDRDCPLMLMQRKSAFSRRLPDLVTEELVAVLSKKNSFEFKQLFDVVHERLRARNAASGGEEMLRLRAYEKLQNLVSRGMVKKTGKKYKGLAALSKALTPPEPIPAGR